MVIFLVDYELFFISECKIKKNRKEVRKLKLENLCVSVR